MDKIKLLEKTLDYSSLKQKVIADNIANINTIGYKRKDVDFENLFDEANNKLKVDNNRHIKSGDHLLTENSNLIVTEDNSKEMVSGFNNVDIDREMAELAENNIMFKFAARRMRQYFSDLQAVIKGGR